MSVTVTDADRNPDTDTVTDAYTHADADSDGHADAITVGLTELIAELQSDDMDGRTGAGTGEVCDTGIDRIGRHDVYCRRPNG
jgi:hypothetical protein